MEVIQKIAMDLVQHTQTPLIAAKQGDANARMVQISLYSGGAAWAVPDGAVTVIRYRKSDGTTGIYDTLPDGTPACSISDNVLTVALAPQVLSAPGLVRADVVLAKDAAALATFDFNIMVEEYPVAGDQADSQNYYRFATLEAINAALTALETGVAASVKTVNGVVPDSSGNVNTPNAGSGGDVVSVNGKNGIVTLTASDVAALPDSGGTITGNLLIEDGGLTLGQNCTFSGGGNRLTALGTPTNETDAANKSYVDSSVTKGVASVFNAGVYVAHSYPTSPGVYRVCNDNIFANAGSIGLWGILIIFQAVYGLHLYVDSEGRMMYGYSGDTFQEPETWFLVTAQRFSTATSA